MLWWVKINNDGHTKANCKRTVQYKVFIFHPLSMSYGVVCMYVDTFN